MNRKIIIAIVVVLILIAAVAIYMMMPISTWIARVRITQKILSEDYSDVGPGAYINLSELQIINGRGENIALGMPATSSSQYNNHYPASNLVDGDEKTFMHTGRSKIGLTEWVEVSLPVPTKSSDLPVKAIVINRGGAPGGRIVGSVMEFIDNHEKIVKSVTFDIKQDVYEFAI